MTYWNEINDSHIQFWNTEIYESYWRIRDQITDEGYRGDKLQSSEVIFLGTCDIMSNLAVGELRWPCLVHANLHSEQPLIALGTVASGLPTMVRRLYSYIQNFGAPKIIYMTVPRFDGYEFVNKSGKCYNASTRVGSANFCKNAGFIDNDEHITWLMQLETNKKLNNIHNMQYMIEERFAFIETICKAYSIKLKWTFNPSDAAIAVLYRNCSVFENISNFMKDAYVGNPEIKDHAFDRSIGANTHREIYNKFVGNEKWDYDKLCKVAELNFKWSTERYGNELIKMEQI
jgi:hypothetical protein